MKRPFPPTIKRRQSGISLVIALIFLIVLTLLGLGMFFSTKSEEVMARNFRDKEIAVQAAEAASLEAKMLIQGSYNSASAPKPPPVTLSAANCYANTPPGFTCDMTTSPSIDLFPLTGTAPGAAIGSYDEWLASRSSVVPALVSPTVTGLSAQARYLIVRMNPDVCGAANTGDCYQIIAQARGRLTNTRVNLVELFTN